MRNKIEVPWDYTECPYAEYHPGELEHLSGRATVRQNGGLWCRYHVDTNSDPSSVGTEPCVPNVGECPRYENMEDV